MILATIWIMEREGPEEDFVTETGRGFPDDLEYHEVECFTITPGMLAGRTLDDTIQQALDDFSVGQWDGGNVAYDPDGTHPVYSRGTRRERYASIKRKDKA